MAGGSGGAGPNPVGWDTDPVVVGAPGWSPLEEPVTADVCVVGLGGSGLAAIGAAADRGLSVVGLDAGRVAAGAAGRNGGILAPGPAIGAVAGEQRWGTAALGELYRATAAEIDHLERLLGPGVIRRTGGLRLVEPIWDGRDRPEAQRERERAAAVAERAVLGRLGLSTEDYRGPLGAGWLAPGDSAMSPPRRALGLAHHLVGQYHGRVRLHEHTPVLAVEPDGPRTPGGRVSAGLVLIAADGRLSALVPELAGRVRPVRLQMLATAPLRPGLLPCPAHWRFGYDYAQQDADGRLMIGGGRDTDPATEETNDTDPTPGVQQWIQRHAEAIAGGPVTVTHRWAASAGYTPDGVPLVVRPRERLVACGGYNGLGNLVGPLAARAALALGLDGTAPPVWFAGPE